MKRNTWACIVGFGGVVAFTSAHGCAFNPFSPPDYDNRPGAIEPASSSSGGAAGMGGTGGVAGSGGLAGVGGSAGQGGSAGAGGAVCMCDGADDGNECTTDVLGACPAGELAKCHQVVPGQPCSAGPSYVCGLDGTCSGDCLVCPDDPACAARCGGQICPDDAGCKTGYCEQGVCCNAECIGPCKSCNREGTVGSCTQLAVGLQVPGCDTIIAAQGKVDACDNDGTCSTFVQAGWPLGHACATPDQCISARCKASGCVSPVDQPCLEDLECSSNRCDPVTHTCKPCSGAGAVPCRPGTTCVGSGVCMVLPGEPAFSNECVAPAAPVRLLCVSPVNAPCIKHEECESHHCKDGTCAPMCNGNADCPAGVTCDLAWKQCKLPKGAFCIAGTSQQDACQSGKCSGFPPRCE